MLVLTRKENEWIDINGGVLVGGVSVVVADIRGDKVKLAFDAPRDTTVNRREVTEKISGKHGGGK